MSEDERTTSKWVVVNLLTNDYVNVEKFCQGIQYEKLRLIRGAM